MTLFCLLRRALRSRKVRTRMQALSTWDQTRTPVAARLFNRCSTWLGESGMREAPTASSLVRRAQRRCRFVDFGPGDIYEPLTRLLFACQREGHLNAIGKLALRSDIVRNLCLRLRLQQARQHEPQIARAEIRAPLFIVGLPRSGTTLLHILLSCDPAHRCPLTWEVLDPLASSSAGEEACVRRAARSLGILNWLAPTFRRVHRTGAALPQECVGLMSPTFLSDQFDTMFYIPSYRDWFLRQEMRPVYEFHRRFLQHLQHRRSATRWVLKAPAHMLAARALLQVYPDAHFVQTHRDPIEAVTSVSSLVTILRSVFSDRVDPRQIGRDALQYWSHSITSFLRTREQLAPGRVCDVYYSHIRRDPLAVVRRIYQHFNIPLTPVAEGRMRLVLAAQPRHQHGRHVYHAAQFGLDEIRDSALFQEYCDRFDLALPAEAEERAA